MRYSGTFAALPLKESRNPEGNSGQPFKPDFFNCSRGFDCRGQHKLTEESLAPSLRLALQRPRSTNCSRLKKASRRAGSPEFQSLLGSKAPPGPWHCAQNGL